MGSSNEGNSSDILILSEDPQASKIYTDLILQIRDCKITYIPISFEQDFLLTLKEEGIDLENYYLCIVDVLVLNQKLILEIKKIASQIDIIIATSTPSVEEAVTVMKSGMIDYLSKPIKFELFKLVVLQSLDRKTNLGENKKRQKIADHWRNDQMSVGLLTSKNIKQSEVNHLVFVDDVTGLYNTRYLNYLLDHEIFWAKESKQSLAVLFIDADFFKYVNDSFGHRMGTRLLFELSESLKKLVREKDTVFRYGGDEFVAVLSPSDLKTAQLVAERIRASIENQVFLINEGLQIQLTVSIGIASFPEHAQDSKSLIDAADRAMYSAKKSKRNCISIAQPCKGALLG